jgi:hypothetical protein
MKLPFKIESTRMAPRELKLMALTGLALVFLGFKMILVKQWKQRNEVRLEVTNLEENILKAQISVNQMKINALAQATASTGNGPEALLEKNNNISSLLTKMSGDGVRFSLNRLVVEEHKVINGYSRTLFNLEIESSFIELGKFIESMENSDFLVDFQSVEISRVDRELKLAVAKIKVFSYASRGDL